MRISVIIPALNEEPAIGDLLDHLSGLSGVDESEDLERLRADLAQNLSLAPRTARLLVY